MKKVLLTILTGTFLAYSFTGNATNSFKEYYSMNWLEIKDPFTQDGEMEIRNVKLPTKTKIDLCSTVGCQTRTTIYMHTWLRDEAEFLMSEATNTTTERKALAKTIAYLESQTCDLNKTCNDRPGVGGNETGQLDCVDEATNTTSYMLWLQKWGLLRWHKVTLPDWKGWHWFATMCEIQKTKKCFIVESDFNKTGQEPIISRR